MQRISIKKPVGGMFIGVCIVVAIPIIVFVVMLIESLLSPYTKPLPRGYEIDFDPGIANVSLTASSADNVYIGELLGFGEQVFKKMPGANYETEFRYITVKVTEVFKGNHKAGDIITDIIPAKYTDFASDEGKSFVFCTGFDETNDKSLRYYTDDALWSDTLWVMDYKLEQALTGWRLYDNPFLMMRINDDGTVTCGDHLLMYGDYNFLKQESNSLTFSPDPMLNEDVNGSVMRSLRLELSNTDRLADKMTEVLNSEISEIRVIEAPWSELYNVCAETEAEFIFRFLNGEEGFWINNGDTTYSFSAEEVANVSKSVITAFQNLEQIREWQKNAVDGDAVRLSNRHSAYHNKYLPSSNPQHVSKYLAFYSGEDVIAVIGCKIYDVNDNSLFSSYVKSCYGLYDAQTGDYAFYTNSTGNLDIGNLIDMLEE